MKNFSVILLILFLSAPTNVFAGGDCSICTQLAALYNSVRLDIRQASFTSIHAPLDLLCIQSPEDKNAIGVVQRMHVHAPLAALAKVLDDFPAYAELFPDLVKVEAIATDSPDSVIVKWTESAPVFFMSNLVHEILYKIFDTPNQKSYRSSLKASRRLKYSEGLIVLMKAGEEDADFLEIDFYNADWSLLKIMGSKRIWDENLKQLALSDLAVKLKAENPASSNSSARKNAEKALDKKVLEECLSHKVPFSTQAILSFLTIPAREKPGT